MAKTRKPCPCCKEAHPYRLREADDICQDCREIFDKAKQIIAETANQEHRELAQIAHAYYEYDYIHHGRGKYTYEHGQQTTDKFQKALHELAKLISTAGERPDDPESQLVDCIPARKDGYSYGAPVRSFVKGVPALLREVYLSCLEISKNAYQEGYDDGQNMFLGLASGRTTIDKFNEANINAGRRPRDEE